MAFLYETIDGWRSGGFIKDMPVGINITGRQMEDDLVLNMANMLEREMGYANQVAKVGETDV